MKIYNIKMKLFIYLCNYHLLYLFKTLCNEFIDDNLQDYSNELSYKIKVKI